MGMDVYGKAPENEAGEYFRRNVWGWRPLWTCVEYCAEDIASKVESPHTNDGTGLNADDSKELAKVLLEKVKDGTVLKWVEDFEQEKKNAPLEDCRICDATGIRTDELGMQAGHHDKKLDDDVAKEVGREFGWCNGCGGRGKNEAFMCSYGLDVECISEFAEFLENSGGFEIC
jgi:hypothetical protein